RRKYAGGGRGRDHRVLLGGRGGHSPLAPAGGTSGGPAPRVRALVSVVSVARLSCRTRLPVRGASARRLQRPEVTQLRHNLALEDAFQILQRAGHGSPVENAVVVGEPHLDLAVLVDDAV